MVFTIFFLEFLAVITILLYFTSVIYLTSYFFALKESLSPIWGAVHTYPDIFLKRRLSPPFSKQIDLHAYCIRIVFARPYKNAKQWKDDSIPESMSYACSKWCIASSCSKISVLWSVHPQTSGQRFQNLHSDWRASLKRCVLADRFHLIRVDG